MIRKNAGYQMAEKGECRKNGELKNGECRNGECKNDEYKNGFERAWKKEIISA